jgi:hypothetical protein
VYINKTIRFKKRLPPCTVFQSELRAIQMACERVPIRAKGHTNGL